MAAVLLALVSRLDGALDDEAIVEDEEDASVLVDGAAPIAAVLLLLESLVDGAVARVLLSLDEGAVVAGCEDVEAVVALSSLRPHPASAAATARAVAAIVSFFMQSLPVGAL
jgi:hypothetical protein